MRPRALLLAGPALLLCFAGIASTPLLEPDEGRYAEIPREMVVTGDFVTPRLNGVPYFEKPPLYYWFCAASLTVFPDVELGARFASALFSFLDLALAYALARSLRGPRAGLFAAGILATAPLHLVAGHVNTIDPTLAFLLDGTLLCYYFAQRGDEGRRRTLAWYGVFAGAALALLCKGLIGIVIPGAVIGLHVLVSRRFDLLRTVPWLTGIPLFLALAVPWHLAVSSRNPGFLWFYFVHEHFLRYATPVAAREHPFWFFFALLIPGLLPWWGLVPGAMPRNRDGLFLALWAGFVLLFFSASKSKLIPYVLPAMLPLSVLLALALDQAWERRNAGVARWSMAAASLLLAALGAGFLEAAFGGPPLHYGPTSPGLGICGALTLACSLVAAWRWARGDVRLGLVASALGSVLLFGCLWSAAIPHSVGRSARNMVAALKPRLRSGDDVYCYRRYVQSLPPYLGRTVGIVEAKGELDFGISTLSADERRRRFPTAAEFRPVWSSKRTVYLVTEASELALLARDGLDPGATVFREGKLLLLVNHVAE